MGQKEGLDVAEGKREDISNSNKQEGLKCNPSEIRSEDAKECCAFRGCVCELNFSLGFSLEAIYTRAKITNTSFKELKMVNKNPFRLGKGNELCMQRETCRVSPFWGCPEASSKSLGKWRKVLGAQLGLVALSFLLAC